MYTRQYCIHNSVYCIR